MSTVTQTQNILSDMKTFKEYCETEGTYACLLPNNKTQKYLKTYVEKLGFNPVDEFHMTLVHSTRPLNFLSKGTSKLDEPIELEVESISMLGDKSSEYRALVFNFNSANVKQLFDEVVEKGYEHHYNDFKQHISLTYQPDELKCDDLLHNHKIKLPKFKIVLDRMKVKSLIH